MPCCRVLTIQINVNCRDFALVLLTNLTGYAMCILHKSKKLAFDTSKFNTNARFSMKN